MRAGEVGGEPASSARRGRSSTFLLAAPSPYVIFMGTGALPWISVVVVALGLLWLIVAAAISILAARRFRLAESVLEAARANATLLALTPARPLLVRPDQKIEADAQLLRDLGLRTQPRVLSDLVGNDSGIAPDDLDLLRADVETARMSAGRVSRRLRAHGSPRVFDVRGGPAPAPEPAGTLLLWFFDTSSSEEERARLALRLRQTEGALNSLTHLIEAAPFPMWYRGQDLRLGLVNSAFVQAVEGKDAGDVIERNSELIDAEGEDSAIASARKAQETGRVVSRMQPAIIHGERRMLRIVNVPLSTGAVAGFAVDVQDLEDARTELARFIESQRELADRMTAGTAQFDADHSLGFFNQPFAAMAQLDPEWLAERPEFDRVIERMRDEQRLPETRDFPAWKEERRAWFTSPEEVLEEEWMLPNGDHIRRRRAAASRRRPAAVPGRSNRAAPAGLGSRHPASRPRRHVRQSFRSDQRVRQRRPAVPLEPAVPRRLGARRGLAREPSARR